MKACKGFSMCIAPLAMALAMLAGQKTAAQQSSSAAEDRAARMESELRSISAVLSATRAQLDDAQQKVQELETELAELRGQHLAPGPGEPSEGGTGASSSVAALAAAVADIREQQAVLQEEVKQHDQVKLESASKYPVRVSGLVLFNAFSNHGGVDNIDLPAIALPVATGSSNISAGGSFRQTILGLQGFGPHVLGARTSADISIDFFAGIAYSSYGTSAGTVRMRTAAVNMDWARHSLEFGLTKPLISPRSPASYASVAEPAMSGAGNLWAWAPQIVYRGHFSAQRDHGFGVDAGLLDMPAAGYNANELFRTASPGELSGQPAYESRLFWKSERDDGPQIGISGLYNRQRYSASPSVDGWAGAADWQMPLAPRLNLTGEAYRGRALGGLGGGVYKDVVSGDSPSTGAETIRPLDAAGGWTQLKSTFDHGLETNVAFGLDDGFAAAFHALVLPSTAGGTQLRARNRMISANLIFRPKTYLIFSPEYRRIWTWEITGPPSTADIFTMSAGYEF